MKLGTCAALAAATRRTEPHIVQVLDHVKVSDDEFLTAAVCSPEAVAIYIKELFSAAAVAGSSAPPANAVPDDPDATLVGTSKLPHSYRSTGVRTSL